MKKYLEVMQTILIFVGFLVGGFGCCCLDSISLVIPAKLIIVGVVALIGAAVVGKLKEV